VHKFVPSICGSSFLTILIFVTSLQITGASAADLSRDKLLEGCNTLDACLQILDRTPKDPDGALSPDASGIAVYLQRFGDPAQAELLKRATGPDRGWENLAGSILMYWPTFSADDVPQLKEALQRDPGGWVAIPLGRIATPEAIQALANDVRPHGGESQSGEALRRLRIKAFPYLLAMLEDDARWKNVAQLLDQMRVDAAGSAPAWAAIATNQARPLRKRLAALHALEAIGSTARAQGPVLRPLLKDTDRSIRDAATDTLRDMGDESVVDGLARSCRPTMSQGKPEPFTSSDFETRCVEEIAAFGAAARPFAPILLSRFLSSKNGRDRALGAALLGYIGFQPATPRLIELLDDTDWRVAFAAARSLSWLRAGIAIPSLTKVAQTHWLPEVKQEAANAIAALQPNAQPLTKPEVRQGHFYSLPTFNWKSMPPQYRISSHARADIGNSETQPSQNQKKAI
jgi:HEAT repeat protein